MILYFTNRRQIISLLLFIAVFIFSCSPRIGPYDNYSYTQATLLKTETLALIDAGRDSYTDHEKEISDIQAKMEKQFDYELHRDHNDITTDLWYKMKDPKANLLGGFLLRWKKEGKLTPAYIAAFRRIIGRAFDQIAEFE